MALRTSFLRFCCSLGFLLTAGRQATAQVGLGFIHPLQECDAKVVNACEAAPPDGKEHVYTFIVNGLDPLQLGNLNGMADHLRRLGFPQTHFEPLTGYRATRRHVREIRQSDPDAKIVLVGYSVGALVVRRLANDLEREGIAVDGLVYLGGDFIGNSQGSRPGNVARVVNIRGHGAFFSGYDLFFKGADIDDAVNLRLDSRHFLLPSRGQTMATLATELARLAQDSHLAIAARELEESPTADLAEKRIEEKSPLDVQPVSRPRQGTGAISDP
jgi:hypothetical protein